MAEFEKRAHVKTLQVKEILFHQGDSQKILYKILTGQIGIYANYGTPEQFRLSLLEKGQCFGEMALLEDAPRSATAVAEGTCSLIAYPAELWSTFVTQNAGFVLEIMRNLSIHLRSSSEEVEELRKLLRESSKHSHQNIQTYLDRYIAFADEKTMQFQRWV